MLRYPCLDDHPRRHLLGVQRPLQRRWFLRLPLLLLLLAGCSHPQGEWREVNAEPPLSKVRYEGNIVAVDPAAGVHWQSLIDLRGVNKLRPGMTFDQAQAHLGPPDSKGTNSLGPYIAYRRSWGNVQVGFERQSSGEDFYETWSLRAYPDRSTARDFLDPAIVKYLNPEAERTEVLLTAHEETVLQVILLRGLRVRSINWFKE